MPDTASPDNSTVMTRRRSHAIRVESMRLGDIPVPPAPMASYWLLAHPAVNLEMPVGGLARH